MINRTIVVGDIHGCFDELMELIEKVKWKKDEDQLILAGDLIDRGPKPKETVEWARINRAAGVRGNHEDKHLRWNRHEAKRLANPKYLNPMRGFQEKRMQEHNSLSPDDWVYLENLPLYQQIAPNYIVVHAGLIFGVPLKEQKGEFVVRARYLDGKNKMMKLEDDYSVPKGGIFWTEKWKGPENIIYGHNVTIGKPRIDEPVPGIQCYGIDTGCCFGGYLTALIFPSMEVVQVKAHAKYASLGRSR